MDMFDQLHRRFFKDIFGVSEQQKQHVEKLLNRNGYSDEQIQEILASFNHVTEGKVYGHAHAVDAMSIVEQAFYQEDVRRLMLEVTADGNEETYDGHLNIRITTVEKW